MRYWERLRSSGSVRARRLSLSVRAGGEVRLTVPAGIGSRTALRFLEEKADWALRAKERMAERYPKQIIAMPYATRSHVLRALPVSLSRMFGPGFGWCDSGQLPVVDKV